VRVLERSAHRLWESVACQTLLELNRRTLLAMLAGSAARVQGAQELREMATRAESGLDTGSHQHGTDYLVLVRRNMLLLTQQKTLVVTAGAAV
jgi:hypothetical protein